MATPADLAYLKYVVDTGLVEGPVLEIGSRSWQGEQGNMQMVCEGNGVRWSGSDVEEGPGVDFLLDILDDDACKGAPGDWQAILLFNLLEHVYDPAAALRNAVRLLRPGGYCVISTPTVWQIHYTTNDYWRPLPDFYFEFAVRHDLTLSRNHMRWLTSHGLVRLEAAIDEGLPRIPSTKFGGAVWGAKRTTWSRLVHRAARTIGRETIFFNCALGLVMQKTNSTK